VQLDYRFSYRFKIGQALFSATISASFTLQTICALSLPMKIARPARASAEAGNFRAALKAAGVDLAGGMNCGAVDGGRAEIR